MLLDAMKREDKLRIFAIMGNILSLSTEQRALKKYITENTPLSNANGNTIKLFSYT